MPSVESNTVYECRECGAMHNFEDGVRVCVCGELNYRAIPVQVCCDFCGLADPTHSYPCEDFTYPVQRPGPTEGSAGPWLACGACHGFIKANNFAGLTERSVAEYIARKPETASRRGELLFLTQAMHEAFAQHRTGAPEPL